ncbi:uncharacterized protein I303_100606 [Kwoniella dejecticola CBS 10117]|uniref:Homologous-pairing protein 2 winged helix domain-containing protein n=1 Tax=Kwoniella dejecticola CBS 10117 TaxID=1296121 RepID=A0A1A6AFD9_9TREE|nr:uncharacterized protein I303_00609 [Kwoniella dejecticola CBS 10117]OBR88792.1 hypothetical protein I303_00609 [Kwoniella dejecticola CBS 10117]
MAPKKEVKEKQVKGDEAEEMVLSYMKETNRPFANADVSANLKNKVPKAAAVKVLATLAEKGQLSVKPYGKQLIYLYNQSLLDVLDPGDLASLDKEIKGTKDELEEKRKELKILQTTLSSKEALPKTKDLAKEIERVQADNDITLKALALFRSTSDGEAAINPLSAEETKQIDKDFNKWRKEWTDRRKIYKELLGMLTDGGQIDHVPAFEEQLDISHDDDEAVDVEKGEFVAFPTPVRQIIKRPVAATKTTNGDTSGSTDEGGKKKKAKKA